MPETRDALDEMLLDEDDAEGMDLGDAIVAVSEKMDTAADALTSAAATVSQAVEASAAGHRKVAEELAGVMGEMTAAASEGNARIAEMVKAVAVNDLTAAIGALQTEVRKSTSTMLGLMQAVMALEQKMAAGGPKQGNDQA